MPDLSLITSLYRSEQHLPQYIERVQQIATQLELSLQLVVVVNDATPTERDLLSLFATSDAVDVALIYCERESLYASWNRGIAAAESDILGFWNVDDVRTVEGLIEGYRLLSNGTELIDFAFHIQNDEDITSYPPAYKPNMFHPKTGVGPFFMIHRRLYRRAGSFNEQFRITGDFEWSKRQAVREAITERSDVVAGTFVLHGDNLSGGTNPREWVEFDIALMIHERYPFIRPVDPDLFESVWAEWGDDAPEVPIDLLDWLIGADASARFHDYERFRKATHWQQRFNKLLSRLGFRSASEQSFKPPSVT